MSLTPFQQPAHRRRGHQLRRRRQGPAHPRGRRGAARVPRRPFRSSSRSTAAPTRATPPPASSSTCCRPASSSPTIPHLCIGSGVVADPRKIWWETLPLEHKGYAVLDRLLIDERTLVSDLTHRLLDLAWEDYRTNVLARGAARLHRPRHHAGLRRRGRPVADLFLRLPGRPQLFRPQARPARRPRPAHDPPRLPRERGDVDRASSRSSPTPSSGPTARASSSAFSPRRSSTSPASAAASRSRSTSTG